MRARRLYLATAAVVTFLGGVVNLLSVATSRMPGDAARDFPLEFAHLSHVVTVLLGLVLAVSSVNIYRRKRRAMLIVVALCACSAVLHLTRDLNVPSAVFSVAVGAFLLGGRRHFTVLSRVPDLGAGLARLAVALGVTLLYGAVGFWFLDRRDFGIEFNVVDSLRKTLGFLALAGDPALVPHTRFAHRFLLSLRVSTWVAALYAAYSLFRPVRYRFRVRPHERRLAREVIAAHGRTSLDFFKLWPDKSFFFSPHGARCVISYRVGAGYAVALGDPVGPEDGLEGAARAFLAMCDRNDWRVAFHQIGPERLPMYERLGFRKLKIGDEAIVDLASFGPGTPAFKKLGGRVNKLEKDGLALASWEPPVPDDVIARAREVSDRWRSIPGRRERTFTLGQFRRSYLRSTPLHAAVGADGRMLAFVNIVSGYGDREAAVDLMRHLPDAPNGVMDFLFTKVLLKSREAGLARFSMGMAPMSGFHESEDPSPEEEAVHYFIQRLNFLFSYRGLRAYKAKYATIWEPRYVAYRRVLHLPLVARAIVAVTELR
jgi:phosphatidylglycerol lysyltransferase